MPFGRFRKRTDSPGSDDADAPLDERLPDPASTPGAGRDEPGGAPTAGESGPDHARRMLNLIRETLRGESASIDVPCEALLNNLPDEFHGPLWQPAGFPDTRLQLPTDDLLAQLKTGRVAYPLRELSRFVPDGWIAADAPDIPVGLDIATVVSAVPPEILTAAQEPSKALLEVDHSRDYFAAAGREERAAAPARTPPVEKPVPATAENAPETAARPAPAFPPKPAAGAPRVGAVPVSVDANVIDLNDASIADLQTIPAIGPSRARLIIDHREKVGPFSDVYELGAIRGVGKRLFARITGLSLKRREDRHAVLNRLLGFEDGARPSLRQIVDRAAETIPARGCVLTDEDAVPLAAGGEVADAGIHYAALVPQFFRRTRRYLRRLSVRKVDCFVMPTATPPVILLHCNRVFLAVVLNDGANLGDVVDKCLRIARELGWLLGRRAVVRRSWMVRS